MRTSTQMADIQPVAPLLRPPPGFHLQRKCACGGSAGMESECKDCNGKRLAVQRFPASRVAPHAAVRSLVLDSASTPSEMRQTASMGLGHNFAQVGLYSSARQVETTTTEIQSGERQEDSEDAEQPDARGASTTGFAGGEPNDPSDASASTRGESSDDLSEGARGGSAGKASSTAAPVTGVKPDSGARQLIVEDDTREVGAGQMRKSEFLDQMEKEVCSAADAELAAAGRSSEGCPYIQNWIAFYRARSSQHVERALRHYAPEAAGAASAHDYIPFVGARVRQAAATWVSTGRITGIPPELSTQLPAAGLAGAAGGIISAAAGAVAGVFGGIGRAIGGLFTKAREGGAREADDPQAIQGQLDSGQPLDGGVKTRMESALGHDFSRVRVHADTKAAELSTQLNARAFTIGSDVSFAAGEYQPGTMIGDALLAHELAHVVQQSGHDSAGSAGAQFSRGETGYNALEEDADQAAVGAVVSLWGGEKKGLAGLARHSQTSLRSGLRLQRCNGDKKGTPEKAAAEKPKVERKSVCIRPVQIANDDGTAPTVLPSFDEAKTIWGKCCVDLTVNAAQKVSKTDYKELDESPNDTPTAEETSLFTDAGAGGSCVSVFVAQTFQQGGNVSKNISGGGGTYDGGKADPKVVVVEGIHPTIVAHEIGHAMGYVPHHPQGTVMEVTASVYTQKESDQVSQGICDKVRDFVSAAPSGKNDCVEDV